MSRFASPLYGLNPDLTADGIFGAEAEKAFEKYLECKFDFYSNAYAIKTAITYVIFSFNIKTNRSKFGGFDSKDTLLALRETLKKISCHKSKVKGGEYMNIVENNLEVNNELIKKLVDARCNDNCLIPDGVIGKQAIIGLREFVDQWMIKSREQIIDIIDALRQVLCWYGASELATALPKDSVDENVSAGILKIEELCTD